MTDKTYAVPLVEGATYRQPAMTDALQALQPGDTIVAWTSYVYYGTPLERGARGAVYLDDDGALRVGQTVLCGGPDTNHGPINQRITEFTVVTLTPRQPRWWGAQCVRDSDADLYLYDVDRDLYVDSNGGTWGGASLTDFEPVVVVVDDEGTVINPVRHTHIATAPGPQ